MLFSVGITVDLIFPPSHSLPPPPTHTHTHTHTHQSTARLLYGVLNAQIKPSFHKLNLHAAMTPADIWSHLEPVFSQAKMLQEAFKNKVADTFSLGVPFVTVSTWLLFLCTVYCRPFP